MTARRVGLAAAVLLAGCAPDERPNLVLVTLDTTRADRVGAMGDAEASTPHLDALAARGVLFSRAYASAPLTLPSHTSMLTGLDPLAHGVRDNGQLVPPDIETATERLAGAGYATAAFVAAFVLDSAFGLDRGFGLYDDEIAWEMGPLTSEVPRRTGAEVSDRALAWLADRGGEPFFLWVHYYDVHEPRAAAPDAEDRYAAALTYADAQVGRLVEGLAAAGRGRETLVLVAGDHGESLGEHDEATHGVVAYDSTLHVPLIAAGPGFAPGLVADAFAQTRDVAPTLLRAAGLVPSDPSEAIPLQDVAAVGAPPERIGVFLSEGPARRFGWASVAGVRDARFKYTAQPAPPELYDLGTDPGETSNLAEAEPEVVARLAARYRVQRERSVASAPVPEEPQLDARLAALGYVVAPQAFAEGEAPDPRRFVGALSWIDAARGLAAEGRVADSIRALEILAESPIVRVLALRSLAPVYLEAGRVDAGAEVYRELVASVGGDEFRMGLAAAELGRGDAGAALAVLDQAALGRDGRPPRAALIRAQALLALDRPDEALAVCEAVLEERPEDDRARALASLARAQGDGIGAEIERLGAEVAAAPPGRAPARRAALAELLYTEGRLPDAAEVLKAGGQEDPEALAVRASIAAAYGNPRLALDLYETALAARPSRSAWRRALAELYRELRRDAKAEALYSELLAAAPDDAELQLARGVVRFRLGRLGDARLDFARAVELAPDSAEAHFNLGLVALQSGQPDAAEPHLRRALELRPEYAKAHFHLARIYREREDPRSAEHAEKAAALSHQLAPVAAAAPATPSPPTESPTP